MRAAASARPVAIFIVPFCAAMARARSKAAWQLLDAVGVHADGEGGAALRAGGGQRGDEGALALRVPAVDTLLLAGHGREGEEVAEVGEVAFPGEAGGATAVADDGDAHPR